MPFKDKEKANKYARLYQTRRHHRLRKEVLETLGGKCAHCGIEDKRVLQIDHIKRIERGKNNLTNQSSWNLISNIYQGKADAANLQILCANCHMIKTNQEQQNL